MNLRRALGAEPGDIVAIVGAGGKTTLAHRLVEACLRDGLRAVFTTTTRIWQPAPGVFDALTFDGQLPSGDWRSACVTAGVEGTASALAVPEAGMPSVQTKHIGVTADAVAGFRLADGLVIVEADGARGLRLKAPGNTEPVMPQAATIVCVLASLDALGRPLDDRSAHRAGEIARLTGAMPGSVITAEVLAQTLAHPDGGRKAIPAHARAVAVLTQHEGEPHPSAQEIAAGLLQAGYTHVLHCAPRAQQPVLQRYASAR
jgi:probable selenium-dependent hydroxylase accessory protein YqeC